jgi:hypothetical protein
MGTEKTEWLLQPAWQKPGIRLSWSDVGHKSAADLLQTSFSDVLWDKGFAVIDGYIPAQKREDQEEWLLQLNATYKSQHLHQDANGSYDIVSLRYTGRSNDRVADTIIGENSLELFQSYVQGILGCPLESLSSDTQATLLDVRGAIEKLQLRSREEANWNSLYPITYRLEGPMVLPAMYASLESMNLVYRHRWEAFQLLFIDNVQMVHAGVERTPPLADPDLSGVYRRTYYRMENGTVLKD